MGRRAKRILGGLAVIATLFAASVTTDVAAQQSSPEAFAAQLSEAYARITSRMEAVVVSIDVTELAQSRRRSRGGQPREIQGVGSGIIVDSSGYILTNNHVVEGANRITVRLRDESEFPATVIGTDQATDLALLRVDTPTALPAARFGNSDAVSPGHLVLALGSPFGFNNSVSAGIVSAKGRDIPGGETFQRFIQTDAAIHPGNSGGPLVNMAAEVIGINTAVITSSRSGSAIGFALPSNTALQVYRQLRANGRVTRGSIGITFNTAPANAASPPTRGVLISEVLAGGPANNAGLRAGDVIIEIAGRVVNTGDALLEIVANQPAGTRVPVRVLRGGAQLNFDVRVADRTEIYPPAANIPLRGGVR